MTHETPAKVVAMVLFDIRDNESHRGFADHINNQLVEKAGRDYLDRYGPVCSERWWQCFDRGDIPVSILVGTVSHVGKRRDPVISFETEDVIEFVSDNEVIAYDRLGIWAAPIRLGDRITLQRTLIELPHWTGSTVFQLDLRAEWLPASVRR